MVTVAEELPFAAVVNCDALNRTCSNCFIRKGEKSIVGSPINLKQCDHCAVVYYCCKECQDEDWKFHKDECQFLNTSEHCPKEDLRILSRIIMRVKRGDLPVAFNGRTFDDLLNHSEERAKDPKCKKWNKEMYESLVQFMGVENVSSEKECASLYGKLCINSIAISSYGITRNHGFDFYGSGLYLGLAVHNHSCRPTCDYFFTGSKAVLRAKDPNTKYSKDLTIAYAPYIVPKEFRREKLRADYYFDCQCERCLDEEEDLLERSGKATCCPDGAVLPRKTSWFYCFKQPLVCNQCEKESPLTVEQINNVNQSLRKWNDAEYRKSILARVGSPPSSAVAENYLKKLDEMESILSPYNLYLLKFVEIVNIICSLAFPTGESREMAMRRYLRTEGPAVLRFGSGGIEETVLTITELYMKVSVSSQWDAAFLKAHNVLIRIYGPEYYLIAELGEYYSHLKGKYDRMNAVKSEEEKEEMVEGSH